MAEWWQNLAGGQLANWTNPSQYANPASAANSLIENAAKLNSNTASALESVPESVRSSWVNSLVQDPNNYQAVLGQMATSGVLLGAGALLSYKPKSLTSKDVEEAKLTAAEYSIGPGLSPERRQEAVTNEGYPGYTIASLGPLRFEIPPAMSSVVSVHGAMGTVAPGAGPGITVRHVQNFSTMLIPGSVPIYQSLGIQGQMLEFVGAFLGFDTQLQLDASKHFVGPTLDAVKADPGSVSDAVKTRLQAHGLTPGESQVYSKLSPDPFYFPDHGQADQINKRGYLGSQYGLSNSDNPTYGMGNLGSWAVSRAFEMQIRRGVPLKFVLNTGVVRIEYSLVIIGFDRIYQRDDRTWYKIQGMVVSSGETKAVKRTAAAAQRRTQAHSDSSADSGPSTAAGGAAGGGAAGGGAAGGGAAGGGAAGGDAGSVRRDNSKRGPEKPKPEKDNADKARDAAATALGNKVSALETRIDKALSKFSEDITGPSKNFTNRVGPQELMTQKDFLNSFTTFVTACNSFESSMQAIKRDATNGGAFEFIKVTHTQKYSEYKSKRNTFERLAEGVLKRGLRTSSTNPTVLPYERVKHFMSNTLSNADKQKIVDQENRKEAKRLYAEATTQFNSIRGKYQKLVTELGTSINTSAKPSGAYLIEKNRVLDVLRNSRQTLTASIARYSQAYSNCTTPDKSLQNPATFSNTSTAALDVLDTSCANYLQTLESRP